MTRRRTWFIAILVAALLIALAVRNVSQRLAARQAAAAPAAPPPALELAATDLARVSATELVRAVEVSGGLKAVHSVTVKARLAAEVKAVKVREGDPVREGQLLVQLDATDATLRLRQAEDQAATARSQLDIARRTLTNNRALVEQGFISRNALETSSLQAAGAEASLRAARTAADLARNAARDAEVLAPLAGTVSQRFVQPGERVGVDARLLEIVDLSQLELEAALAPDDAVELRVGQRATLSVEGVTQPLAAQVARINPSAQSGTRAVLAYLRLDSVASGLRQGLFARGRIDLLRRQALVVPTSAVRIDEAAPYVLVVRGEKVEQLPVQTGMRGRAQFDGREEGAIEISGAIQAGDTVLRATVGALRAGTAVKLPSSAP